MRTTVEIYNHFLLLNWWYWSVPQSQHQSCDVTPKKKITHMMWMSPWSLISALAGSTDSVRNHCCCHKLNSRYGKTRANIAFYAISFGNSGVLRRPKCPLWLNLFISLRQGRVSHPLLMSERRRWLLVISAVVVV